MKYRQVLIVFAILAVSTIGVLILSSHRSMSPSNSSSNAAVSTSNVTIKNYMFSPAAIKVKVGTTVTWTNQDDVNHTVTADTTSSLAPSSMDIPDGQTYQFTFQHAGTYTYHCFPHPYMHGTIIVTS
jgi:plastocyanin